MRESGRPILVVSRGDSTLRGHFPGEMDKLVEGLGMAFDAWLLIPALIGADRYTINDIHYARDGEWLVPVGNTPYARDATFGYRSSRLQDWVEERSQGRFPAQNVASISIEDIRLGGPQRVFEKLLTLPPNSIAIANAASRRDFEVLAGGIAQAKALGRQYLVRTTATYIPARYGLGDYPYLQTAELNLPKAGGGLLVIGSYVAITGQQMQVLFERQAVCPIEVQVANLLDPAKRGAEIISVAKQADLALEQGQDTAIFTSRNLIAVSDPEQSLAIGRQVSAGVIEILKEMKVRPSFLLAKGGITGHDVATRGMGVKRAMVLGQISKGISIWQLGPETRYPGLAYVVFPGNVGGPETLADVVEKLHDRPVEVEGQRR